MSTMTNPRSQSIARTRPPAALTSRHVTLAHEIGDGVPRAVVAVAVVGLHVTQRGLDAIERLAVDAVLHLLGAVGEVLQDLLVGLLDHLLALLEVALAQLLEVPREDLGEIDLLPG